MVSKKAAKGLPIVGIGASAGGLEAWEQFFRHAPVNSGMALMLVQHLDPNHASLLTEILQRTTMPVVEAQDQSQVEHQASNEELKSTNEEMQSTNEELETSKEELLSVNEELITVNSDLQAKIVQLARELTESVVDTIRATWATTSGISPHCANYWKYYCRAIRPLKGMWWNMIFPPSGTTRYA